VKILAIETSMGRTSAALAMGSGAPLLVRRLAPGAPQAEGLMPLIQALMAEAGAQFAELDRIAVSTGPGGFSGIRTGVAAARGIGLAAGVPVAGTSSFQILAAAFEREMPGIGTYGIVAPAGINAVFCQILGAGRVPVTEVAAPPHAEASAFFDGRVETVAGPAARMLSEAGYITAPLSGGELFPDAETLARIAPDLDPTRDLPSPYYVRPPDARPQTGHHIARKDD
jgi:tRNA threonylcarbamoyladenosine biosynthesis protein TsaB